MKKHPFLLLSIATSLLAAFGVSRASAQIFASDNAGPYSNWQTGSTAGTGFQPWVMYNTGGAGGAAGYAGTFLGNGGAAVDSTNGNFWGMYANSASTASSEAFRAFSNSLPVNATFTILWQNTDIGLNSYNLAGFNLRNGDNTNLMSYTSFIADGSVLSLFYEGGGSDNYEIYDGNGINPIPVDFKQGSAGLQIQVTLLPNNEYNLLVENVAGTQIYWSTNSQPLVGSGTIDSVALYAFDTDGDQRFNNMEIYYAPPQVVNLTPVDGSIYVPTDSPFSFAVTSAASTISSNKIQMTLNGVIQTGADWTVVGSGTSSNQVTMNYAPLQPNQIYNGTVVATDAAGNSSTNSFTFNTWLTAYNNIYIEGADYNYGGGQFIDNALYVNGSVPEPPGTYIQPNQDYALEGGQAEQGVDYLINTNTDTGANVYRSGDLASVENATDADHNSFAANGDQPYDLDYNESGQWEDYTRELSNNVTYAVYARMATFGGNATMSLERMATATVNSSNQPGALLGTFVAPDLGGTQNYGFVPLTDFFSNPVLINFGGTNTFRTTDIGASGVYNLGYLLLLAVTNQIPLGPYVASGYPYPGASGANPEDAVSFTIANRTTSVVPGSIELFLNGTNVTSSLSLSNNAAGTLVTYQPGLTSFLPAGANTAEAIFSDGSVLQTDVWQYTVESYSVLPTSWALPLTASYSPGFSEEIAKGDDNATNSDFPPTLARAVAQLAGTLTNSLTGQPYANEALNGGTYIEPNTINYAIDPSFDGLFSPTNPFPDIVSGETNNVAMAADMYVQLSPGLYNFDVYSDDGFQFSAGSTPTSTNMILGIADYGRAPSTTQFTFLVQTAGLYPMQLIYFKSQLGGGGVELYYNGASGNVLLNDPNTAGSIKAYYLGVPSLVLHISRNGNNAVLSWSNTSAILQSATSVNGPYTTISGAVSPYPVVITGQKQFFRLAP
jgi:hypothetical protein